MDLKTVGVIGAGTMGHGIAQVSAQAGFNVVVYDTTLADAQRGLQRINDNLAVGVQKGKLSAEEREATMERLIATASTADFAACDLVIEAVPEDLALKQKVFREFSAVCRPNALLATNTSALSVSEIASTVDGPERVVGLHFFNPVHLMKLLEVVRGRRTSDETMAIARAFGERIGKQLVEVNDAPGFASSRLGVALGMEAIRMVEQGVASPADIDRAMELGYGHPMGPLKLTDLVGLDVRLAIAERLHRELGSEAFRPPKLLEEMVRAGKLGKKSGKGFYSY